MQRISSHLTYVNWIIGRRKQLRKLVVMGVIQAKQLELPTSEPVRSMAYSQDLLFWRRSWRQKSSASSMEEWPQYTSVLFLDWEM